MSPANEIRKSKAERTSEAREKARLIREAQLTKDKRNKLLIGWALWWPWWPSLWWWGWW